MHYLDVQNKALEAMAQDSFYPISIKFDRKIHRFKRNPNENSKSCWYFAFKNDDNFFMIVYNDWKETFHEPYKIIISNKTFLSYDEGRRIDEQIAKIMEEQKRQLKIKKESARINAEYRYDHSLAASLSHPYLKEKGFTKTYGIRQDKDFLIVPLYNYLAEMQGIQTIDKDGFKYFPPGTSKSSHFFPLSKDDDFTIPIVFTEGVATAMSVHEATGLYTVACFDGGNIEKVHSVFRTCFGHNYPFIIAADNDPISPNTGIRAGYEYAKKAQEGSRLTFIRLPPIEGDFNDYHLSHGLLAVKETILENMDLIKENFYG